MWEKKKKQRDEIEGERERRRREMRQTDERGEEPEKMDLLSKVPFEIHQF